MKRFGKSKAATLRRLDAQVRWDLAAIEAPPADHAHFRAHAPLEAHHAASSES
jgi:hypothetical protein